MLENLGNTATQYVDVSLDGILVDRFFDGGPQPLNGYEYTNTIGCFFTGTCAPGYPPNTIYPSTSGSSDFANEAYEYLPFAGFNIFADNQVVVTFAFPAGVSAVVTDGFIQARIFFSLAAAGGDPHITTLAHQKFDLNHLGKFNLFSDRILSVNAEISTLPIGESMYFFTGVGVSFLGHSGRSLLEQDSERLTFSAELNEDGFPVLKYNGEEVPTGTTRGSWSFKEFPDEKRASSEMGGHLISEFRLQTSSGIVTIQFGRLFGNGFFNVNFLERQGMPEHERISRTLSQKGLFQAEHLDIHPKTRQLEQWSEFMVEDLLFHADQ